MPRVRPALLVPCLLVMAFPLAARAGEPVEIPLGWEGGNPVPTVPETIELSFSGGAGLAVPEGAVDPRFGRVPLRAAPRGGVAVALDLAPGHERVWVDSDLDGSLTDEQPVAWHREGLRWHATADVSVSRGAATLRVPLRMWRGAFRPDDEFVVEARVHRWGAAPVGGRLVMVALEDADGDLRFTPDGPDRAYVDTDGDGRFTARPGATECVPLGGDVQIAGRRMRLDAAPDGGRAVLYDAPPATGDRLPEAGAAVPPPDADLDTLFARYDAERKLPVADRAATLRDIGALGTGEALALLHLVAREDVDLAAREIAAEAMGNPAFLGPGGGRLIALARGRSSRVSIAAIRGLHRMGHPERGFVYDDLLDAPNMRVVEEAARHLAAIDSAAARGSLVQVIEDAAVAERRLAAYRGAARGPLGVPARALAAAAADPAPTLRHRALDDALDARDGRSRQLLHEACGLLTPGEDARPLLPLLARCGDARCVDAIVTLGALRCPPAALALLQRMDDSVTSLRLVDAVDHERPEVRAFAADALGLRGDPRAEARMLERLEEEREGYVREALLRALSDLGSTRAIAALERATSADGGGGPRAFYGVLATPWVRGVPEAQSAFRLGLRDDLWKVRVAALESISAAGETGVLREVRDTLRDDHRVVRRAAAEALGEVRDRASVRPLIDALATERSDSVRQAVGTALFRLTGVNLYDDVELWGRWWQENGDTFVVPEAIPFLPPAAVAGTSAPEPAKFYGIPLETESVVFVIDQSGSMGGGGSPFMTPGEFSGSKWETAVRELLAAVEHLEDDTEVNVVLFETGVRSWRRSLQRLSSSTRKSLRRYLAKLQPGGATNLYDALERALRTPDVETIVLLSDGAPTHGKLVDQASILAAVQDINSRRGVVIHTVSIGGGSPLLRLLARQNDGEYATR